MTTYPTITHSGEVSVRDSQVQVAVLSNGKRVIVSSDNGLIAKIPEFFDNLASSNSIKASKKDVERYKVDYQKQNGEKEVGYDTAVIVDLAENCLVYADELARKGVEIPDNDKDVVEFSRSLMVCLACIGMTALIDETTSFQDARDPKDLSKKLATQV